jgi:hypothetical protein
MRNSCSSVSKLLERYFDQEVTGEESSLINEHLTGCISCRETLRSLVELRDLVKAPVEEAAREEDFPWVWQKIERETRLQEKASWWETLRSSVNLSHLLRKKVWVPAAALAAILIFFTVPLLFKETPLSPDRSIVEYVESPTYNVMVYHPEKTDTTVIWLFDGPEMESPAS